MGSALSKANHEDGISVIASNLLSDEALVRGYLEILNKHQVRMSTNPVEARSILIEFERSVLLPLIQKFTEGLYANKKLGLLLVSRIFISFPSLGIASVPGFNAHWENRSSTSRATKNSIVNACLKQDVYANVKFMEIKDKELEKKFNKIIIRMGDKVENLDHRTLQYIPAGFGIYGFFNFYDNPLIVLNEAVTTHWVLSNFLRPIILLYNNLLTEDGVRLIPTLQKPEYLRMEKSQNLQSDDFKLSQETFQTFPDITLVLKPSDQSNLFYNIANFEVKLFNCINEFSQVGLVKFKPWFLQVFSQIISGNFLISCLTDGYSLVLMKINFNNQLEEFLTHPDKPGTKIPICFKMVNIAESGVTAKASILGMLDDEVRNFSESDYKRKISKIQRLKEICLKSNVEFVNTLFNWVHHHFSESKNYPSYEIDYAPDIFDENHISLFQNGPGEGPQILLLSKALCKRLLNVKWIRIIDREPVAISIYDPTRYQIQNYTEGDALGLKEAQNLFMNMYKSQVKAYDIINKFNKLNGFKINVLTHFKTGNIKLKIKDFSYYAGKYIIHEHVTGRPSTKQHYEQAIEQVQLLNEAGIQLDYIDEKDIVLANGKIYLTNFNDATFGKGNECYPVCLSILESLRDNASKSKRSKHK
ncbi:hypothetical protein BN7_3434 [Wickerhamomyces ciferrii]|uniref:Uncharacterized protein n=1 Tax=Wickerhamomyces ciferrii (strain ATCC 14091 / BCRC 22168 / CBS 111 / JCM 3599 / NBRC 0793 / NRRL Y-1031 F-60-10) TaxID=1206466 RepID=K0KFH8_WICCF|nr:uncharacterized protein BN7_3434 [Wickerhamomyces ciferrii]CCH43880.1 hypothetical protein BN7_3434 [Wickerhamomyces ciferrii]